MEIIIIAIILIALGAARVIAWMKSAAVSANAGSRCPACVNVHRVKGFNGKELIFCNFGNKLHAVKFAVRECTSFCSNSAPGPAPVRVAGFVRVEELSKEEAFPATVIRIER